MESAETRRKIRDLKFRRDGGVLTFRAQTVI
jgi:hypothetical protein